LKTQDLIVEIKKDRNEVLSFIVRKFFPISRKILGRKGIQDSMTPQIFTSALIRVLKDIRCHNLSEMVDFNSLLQNALIHEAANFKSRSLTPENISADQLNANIVANCVLVLDEQAQRLIYVRYVEQKSFEEIAQIFNFSNPVIAQFETDKAYKQLEGIVKVRLSVNQN